MNTSVKAKHKDLGSAKEGVSHWWWQRLTATALIPLSLWFVYALATQLSGTDAMTLEWLSSPLNAVLMSCFIVCAYHHAQLGVQVVIEDYIHHEGWKFFWLIGVKFLTFFMALLALYSVLKAFFGG